MVPRSVPQDCGFRAGMREAMWWAMKVMVDMGVWIFCVPGSVDLCGFVGLAPLAWAVVRKAERVHPYGTAIEVQVAFSAGITGVNGLAGRHGGQERSPFVIAALQRRTRKSGCPGGAALADRGGISRRRSIASSPVIQEVVLTAGCSAHQEA